MHVCLRSLCGEREFAQALFFERVREATDSPGVTCGELDRRRAIRESNFQLGAVAHDESRCRPQKRYVFERWGHGASRL